MQCIENATSVVNRSQTYVHVQFARHAATFQSSDSNTTFLLKIYPEIPPTESCNPQLCQCRRAYSYQFPPFLNSPSMSPCLILLSCHHLPQISIPFLRVDHKTPLLFHQCLPQSLPIICRFLLQLPEISSNPPTPSWFRRLPHN